MPDFLFSCAHFEQEETEITENEPALRSLCFLLFNDLDSFRTLNRPVPGPTGQDQPNRHMNTKLSTFSAISTRLASGRPGYWSCSFISRGNKIIMTVLQYCRHRGAAIGSDVLQYSRSKSGGSAAGAAILPI